MKTPIDMNEAELRSRFDFSKPSRGRFYERYQKGHSVTLLEHDPDAHYADPLESNGKTASTRQAGKSIFVSHVQAAGLKVAEPLVDNNIDYLIYRDADSNQELVSYAVKLKVYIHETFSLSKHDLQINRSLLAYVWNVNDAEGSSIYALSYKEALQIVEAKPYGKSESWLKDGGYSITHAGSELKQMLEPYRMTKERWLQRLQSI